jgi:hypothetical protein
LALNQRGVGLEVAQGHSQDNERGKAFGSHVGVAVDA